MRDAVVAAAGAVLVLRCVAATGVARGAARRVRAGLGDHVLIVVVTMGVVQVAVVQIADVTLVLDGAMAAAGRVLVVVIAVSIAGIHATLLLRGTFSSAPSII